MRLFFSTYVLLLASKHNYIICKQKLKKYILYWHTFVFINTAHATWRSESVHTYLSQVKIFLSRRKTVCKNILKQELKYTKIVDFFSSHLFFISIIFNKHVPSINPGGSKRLNAARHIWIYSSKKRKLFLEDIDYWLRDENLRPSPPLWPSVVFSKTPPPLSPI